MESSVEFSQPDSALQRQPKIDLGMGLLPEAPTVIHTWEGEMSIVRSLLRPSELGSERSQAYYKYVFLIYTQFSVEGTVTFGN